MFVRHMVQPEGLRARLRVKQVTSAGERFARVVRQSDCLELDKIQRRQIKDQEVDIDQLLNTVLLEQMVNTVRRVDKWAGKVMWNGDVENSTSFYQECDGLVKLLENANTIEHSPSIDFEDSQWYFGMKPEWYIVARPEMFVAPGPLAHIDALCISDDAIKEKHPAACTFTSNVYILPLSKEPGDDGIYEQRVDYRWGRCRPEGVYFWTDDGEFLWQPEKNRWDFSIECQTEFRMVVSRPELVTVIKDVPIVLKPVRDIKCQQ